MGRRIVLNEQESIKQKCCLNKTAELWNEILNIPIGDCNPDDINDLRYHIHAIQNILYTQLYIKENGKI